MTKHSLSTALVREVDDAYTAFSEAMDKVMAELEKRRALIEEYDELVERQMRTKNLGAAFVFLSGMVVNELVTGRPLAAVLAERFGAAKQVLQ